MPFHSEMVPSDGGIHGPSFKDYTDVATLKADTTQTANKIGRVARELDTDSLWMLLDNATPTWIQTTPGTSLEIKGAVANPGILELQTAETTVVDGNVLGQINFSAPDEASGGDALLVAGSIWVEADGADFDATNNPGAMVFATAVSETAAENMRLTSDGKLGIGTATVPHGGIGLAKLAIDGPSGGAGGPHIQLTVDTDDYPVMQFLPFAHDNVHFAYDASHNGSAWISSDAGSNYVFGKTSDVFSIQYNSGTSAGDTFTFVGGISLNTLGDVGIGHTGAPFTPTAQIHVVQPSTSGAQPVALFNQADIDEDYFKFIGTSDTNVDRALIDAADFTTPGAIVGYLKINIQDDQSTNPITDGDYVLHFYQLPTA